MRLFDRKELCPAGAPPVPAAINEPREKRGFFAFADDSEAFNRTKQNDSTGRMREWGIQRDRREKSKLLFFILGGVGLLLIAALLVFLLAPVKFTHYGPADAGADTHRVLASSIQPIFELGYAFDPADSGNISLYKRADAEGGAFKKQLSIPNDELPGGDTVLWVYARTLFGPKFTSYQLGGAAARNGEDIPPALTAEENLVPIDDVTYLVTNQLIVVVGFDTTLEEVTALAERNGAEVTGWNSVIGEAQFTFESSGREDTERMQAQLLAEPLVEAVYFDVYSEDTPKVYPNDPLFDDWDETNPQGNNWGPELIDAPGAWEYAGRLQPVKIGVLDSSLQYYHPDLNIPEDHLFLLPTDDFNTFADLEQYYQDSNPTHRCQEQNCLYCGLRDHGTHCTGIIAANHDNGEGVAGVAWNAEMYFANFWYLTIPEYGQIDNYESTSAFIYNITRLASSGCRVISLSIGSTSPSQPNAYEAQERERIDRAVARLEQLGYDFLICKSAGNEHDEAGKYRMNRVLFDGEHTRDHVIIVAAVENTVFPNTSGSQRVYSLSWYSNYDEYVEIAAPGSDILSTVFDGYELFDGTSMATPMVAACAGLVYGANPNLTSAQVKEILIGTAQQYAVKYFSEYDWSAYPIVNARAAVEWALSNDQDLPERGQPEYGFISGIIQDASTNLIVTDSVTVTAVDQASGASYVYITGYEDQGAYQFHLPVGMYDLTFEAEGYITAREHDVEITASAITHNVLLNLVPEGNGQSGVINGYIIDAFTGSGIEGAELFLIGGINSNDQGPRSYHGYSGQNGAYSGELEPGNYTLFAVMDGYMIGKADVVVLPGTAVYDQNCTMTPILGEGQIRIVLTWGQYPADIDSHLVGPAPDGDTFHIYWHDKEFNYSSRMYSNLDVDDTDSYGPETTTIYISSSGTYTFYVHDYSNRQESYSTELATSGAQVKVYLPGRSDPLVYNVPYADGTLWEVFSLSGTTITPINRMSYEEAPSRVGR